MKKVYIALLAAILLATACSGNKDNPVTPSDGSDTNPPVEENPVTPAADAEDDLSATSFDRTITITYSTTADAVAEGDANGIVSIAGNHVTVNNTSGEKVKYILTGASADGSFKLYSEKKQAIFLQNLSLTNPSGAAINSQSKKRCFLVPEGVNVLSDGASATYTATGSEDLKAVVFSEGQLIVCGTGSLTIKALNAVGKGGLATDDYVHVLESPVLKVDAGSSAGHGLRGKDYVRISGGSLEVTTRADMKKAITSDDYVLVEGGTTVINVSGGTAYDSEDAEYKGSAGIKADNYFAMTGGSVTITNTGDGGKGVHAGSYDFDATNHTVADSYITGGTLFIIVKGSEKNDVSAKGMKIGWATKNGTDDHAKVTAYAGNLFIGGGRITVVAEGGEGVESKGDLVISGGEVSVTSKADDAINCQAQMTVKGGYVYAFSSANDALDSNHDTVLSGGYVLAVSTCGGAELGIDANSEEGYKVYINSGATVVAYGGIEKGYSAAQTVYSLSGTSGAWNALGGASGMLAAFKAPAGVSSFAVSAPGLTGGYKNVSVSGETYCGGVWAVGGISGGTSVSLGTYSSGGGFPGGGGGGFPGGGGGGGRP